MSKLSRIVIFLKKIFRIWKKTSKKSPKLNSVLSLKSSDKYARRLSSKPYFLRAIYEWIVDNQGIPYIIAEVKSPCVKVPLSYVMDQRIVLNISPMAVGNLQISNDRITFSARF